jgi:hypothetical protein
VYIRYIVDEQQIGKLPIDDPQILNVETLLGLMAVVPRKSVGNELRLGIEVIDDGIGVVGVAGGEDHDLKVLAELSEAFPGVGPNVDANTHFVLVREVDGEGDVGGGAPLGVEAVD